MTLAKGKLQALVYEYDFAREGGAIGAIELLAAKEDGKASQLEPGFIVTNWSLHVEEAITSGGTPTITIGDGTDVDGYAADVFALVGTDNLMVNRGAVAGALVWDDTNDHEVHHRIGAVAANKQVIITVAVAALTAGKVKLYVHGYRDFS